MICSTDPTKSSPLFMLAVRFCIAQAAVLSRNHDSELGGIGFIIEEAVKLAEAGFAEVKDPFLVKTDAVGLLSDVLTPFDKSGPDSSPRTKVIESLLSFTYFNVPKLLARLCILLARGVGADALKIFVGDALAATTGGGRTTYQLFCASCFVIASRNVATPLGQADENSVVEILRSLTANLTQDNLLDNHARVVLKMSRACICCLNLELYENPELSSLMKKLVIDVLRLMTEDLPSLGAAMSQVLYPAVVESLGFIHSLLLRIPQDAKISEQLLVEIIEKLKTLIGVSKVEVRSQCVRVLRALAYRHEISTVVPLIFELSMDLVLDPDRHVVNTTVCEILPEIASTMLVLRNPSSVPRHVTQPDCSNFTVSDFENVMAILSMKDSEWHRVRAMLNSRSDWQDETNPPSSSTKTLLLGTVRQAAAWCVKNRLRTHFGGPAQTFSCMEQLLMMHAMVDREAKQDDSRRTDPDDGVEVSLRPSPQPASHARKSNSISKLLTLEFVSAVEMYMADTTLSTGAADASNPESEAFKTFQFFKANRKVCEDWLSRIRPLLLEISTGELSPEFARYHSYAIVTGLARKLTRLLMPSHAQGVAGELFDDVRKIESELDSALFSLCRSYCATKDIDSIVGFAKWSVSLSSVLANRLGEGRDHSHEVEQYGKLPLFPWLKAVSLEAEMRYEDAAVEYGVILSRVLPSFSAHEEDSGRSATAIFEAPMIHLRMPAQSLLGCIKQCAMCYAAVGEWTKLRIFVSNFLQLASSLRERSWAVEGYQDILDCCNLWTIELPLISALENQTPGCTVEALRRVDWTSEPGVRLNDGSLQKWAVLGDLDKQAAGLNVFKVNETQLHALFREKMIHVSLQPASVDPCAGECIRKDVEQILLELDTLKSSDLKRSLARGIGNIVQDTNKLVKLDHTDRDSGSWAKAFYELESAHILQESHDCAALKENSCRNLIRIAELARSQQNLILANRLLNEAEALVSTERNRDLFLLERSRLLISAGSREEGIRLLQDLCDTVVKRALSGDIANADEKPVEPLLYLASTFDQVQVQVHDQTLLPDLRLRYSAREVFIVSNLDKLDISSTVDQVKELKGHCLHTATKVDPNSSEAWLEFSNWCYDQSKLAMDRIMNQNGYIDLNQEEEAELVTQLDRLHFGKEDRDAVVRGFLHLMENGVLFPQRYETFRQLCVLRSSEPVDTQAIDQLVLLQKKCHFRVLRFHKLAAEGYGKHLNALASSPARSPARGQTVTVVLRVLRLLTSYGVEQDIVNALEGTFASGPIAPWCQVVPQLLSRAADPNPAVSSLVCLMLKRLARHSPHLVVYPAVVESVASKNRRGDAAESGKRNQLDEVLAELNNHFTGLVSGVRLLVSELQRISILWDEAWITTLVKLSADVARRASTLEKEAARVEKNASLSLQEKNDLARRKFVAIMKPILVSIENLWEETCESAATQKSVTPHERLFLHEHGGSIAEAMKEFRDMCNSDAEFDASRGLPGPSFVWNPFADILKSLLNSSGRRDCLPLQEISPAMTSISKKRFVINMPGVLSYNNDGGFDPVALQAVHSTVTVLRTKTKPKCLDFVGSDGQSYKYLLKAREDLRLDERVMQLLKTSNEFLRVDSDSRSRNLAAQHYSVIPLSRDSGLIQMVPDVTPMFQVYTNWSELSHNARSLPVSPPSKLLTSSTPVPQQNPPTAAFYAKLKQYGVTDVSPNQRTQWPKAVLKQVYQDLVSQRPRDVLRQEITTGSGDFRESWSKTARLSKSLAVMSVLGYIVGLGDRHLDNILLCNKSGDVVHIDYNVCFDKGQKLKVPEVVPFRLTPMLQDALGLTGVEGKFRAAFETTLRVVRANDSREALLTLLEAFVYDPLVDWTVDGSKQSGPEDLKTRLEVNVNLSLFLSRAEERRHDATIFERHLDAAVADLSRRIAAAAENLSDALSESVTLAKLEKQEEKLASEILTMEEKRSECHSVYEKELAELQRANSTHEVMKLKLISISNECSARHQQIEKWTQKNVEFINQSDYASLATSPVQTSFSWLYERLCETTSSTPTILLARELLSSLHAKIQHVDANVAHLRYSLETVTNGLRPYLASYSHIRKEIEEFVYRETGRREDNVYFLWWKRCTEYLGLIEAGDLESAKSYITSLESVPPTLVPSNEQINDSAQMVHRLGNLEQLLSEQAHHESDLSSMQLQFDQLLQNLATTLCGIKLSNAQGQRVLKLGGASWMVSTVNRCREKSFGEEAGHFGSAVPDLTENRLFRVLLGSAKATFVLHELVLTPKGAMKKVRCADFLHGNGSSQQHKDSSSAIRALAMYCGVLDALQQIHVAVYDNLFLDLHGMQAKRDQSKACVLSRLENVSSAESLKEILFAASRSAQASSPEQSFDRALDENPAVCNVLKAVSSLFEQFSLLEESHPSVRPLSEPAQSRWIEVALSLCSAFTDEVVDFQLSTEKATKLFSSHLNNFLRDHLVEPLDHILSGIISEDWKFDFMPPIDETRLLESWQDYVVSQIPDIFPSTLLENEDPEAYAKNVQTTVAEIANVCVNYCSKMWGQSELERWSLAISDLYRYHRSRLWYSFWFSGRAPSVEYADQMTQTQLLTALPAFAAELNRLLGDQVVLESLVLELAQQMEYVASQILLASTEENLHEQIRACYSQVSSVFEHVRDLADLVHGISVVETSTLEIGPQLAQLEVDTVGRKTMGETLQAADHFITLTARVCEKSDVAQKLKNELEQKRNDLHAIATTKQTHMQQVHSMCKEREEDITTASVGLIQQAQNIVMLLKAFDKFKASTREKAILPGEERQASNIVATSTPKNRNARRSSAKGNVDIAQSAMSTFSFMENERLVKILLRNIKSSEHLKTLENVLVKHEANSATLHGIVSSIDHALQQFISDTQLLLTPRNAEPLSTFPTSFLAITQRSASSVLESGSGAGTENPLSSTNQAVQMGGPRSYQLLRALMTMIDSLVKDRLESNDLPQIAMKLVKQCLRLFFEATDMANRLSSLEKVQTGDSSDGTQLSSGVHADEEDFNVSIEDGAPASVAGNDLALTADSEDEVSGPDVSDSLRVTHVQERNRHGVQVLKRIEEKLYGHVSDHGTMRALTVEQQANWLIGEATKVDNLCVMYEGWTPWI
ncbi:Phosphatidylinositol kinase, partial [Globisporangium splendens]